MKKFNYWAIFVLLLSSTIGTIYAFAVSGSLVWIVLIFSSIYAVNLHLNQ